MSRPHPFRCVLFGEAPLLLYCAETLLERGHLVDLVVTGDEGIERWADRRALNCGDDDLDPRVPDAFDLLLDVGHPTVIAPSVVARARHAIRFHDGPLPAYAGYNVTTWALLAGEDHHGISWHSITGRGHGGPVVSRVTFPVGPRDTIGDLEARCLEAGVASFDELVVALEEGRLRGERQDATRRRWFDLNRTPPAAGVLDWRRPAGVLVRMVRTLCGGPRSPIAWATMAIGREAVVVEKAEVAARDASSTPGTVLALEPEGMTVAAGAGAVRLRRIWRQDGRPLRFTDLPVSPGEHLPTPDTAALEALDLRWRPDAALWARRLGEAEPVGLPWGEAGAPESGGRLGRAQLSDAAVVAAACVLLARATGAWRFDVGVSDARRLAEMEGLHAWFSPSVPMRVELDPDADLAVAESMAQEAWAAARRTGHRRDLAARVAGRRGPLVNAVVVMQVEDASRFSPPRDAVVACVFDRQHVRWWAPPTILGPLERGYAAVAQHRDGGPVRRIPLLSAADRARVEGVNAAPQISPLRVGDVLFARAACTPEAVALHLEDQPLTWASLEARANRLARHLMALGVGRGDRVAVALSREGDRLLGLLAVVAAGGVAVVLDPEAPVTRLARQAPETGITLTTTAHRDRLPVAGPVVCLDGDAAVIGLQPADPVACPAEADDEACVFPLQGRARPARFTHAQLVSILAGVDEVISARSGAWLGLDPPTAPTAVVDALWALSRGMELAPSGGRGERPLALSLACASAEPGVLDAVARFAEGQGFSALWLLDWGVAAAQLPDAAVAAAAAAMATDRVALRAVTVVPTEPSRSLAVWGLVQGFAGGRLGLAARAETTRRAETALAHLRTLGAAGAPAALWLVAEDAEGCAVAGRLGAHVVLVIGGHTREALGGLVSRYRSARADGGHAGRGHVTLVVPALVGEDDAAVRAWARAPLAGWLRRTAGPGPAVPLDNVALCGDPARCARWLAEVAAGGVDEVACLVDFGLPAPSVRAHLPSLIALRAALHTTRITVPELIGRHGVTHLAVPAERLREVLTEPGADAALVRLRHLVVIGESLPDELLRAARAAVGPGVRLTRRFGPPGTAAWCLAQTLVGDERPVPFGLPVGQVQVHVLDGLGEPVPLGAPGELCLGGVSTAEGAHPSQIFEGEVPLLRTGLRVRQALDGAVEPAPLPLPAPTEPPAAGPARLPEGSPLERAVLAVVAEVVGMQDPRPDIELFTRIGEPEVVLRLADRLTEALHREVSLVDLFTHRSVRALVKHLRAERDERRRGRRPRDKRRRRRD